MADQLLGYRYHEIDIGKSEDGTWHYLIWYMGRGHGYSLEGGFSSRKEALDHAHETIDKDYDK